MRNLIAISSGLISPKKGDKLVRRRHRYLNYGFCSLLNSDFVPDGTLVHGGFENPIQVVEMLTETYDPSVETTCLLSCPSFLSLEWASIFLSAFRNTYRKSLIVLGGRWVVDNNIPHLQTLLPEVDRFLPGIGEAQLQFFMRENFGIDLRRTAKAESIYMEHGLSFLDYNKLAEPQEFVPSFELSRGCGAGCSFCAEANAPLTRIKPASVLVDELRHYEISYKDGPARFYGEASSFIPKRNWIENLLELMNQTLERKWQWRTEARVDVFEHIELATLAKTGLSIIDLGLESASRKQLIGMGKTKTPEKYLRKAATLLKRAHDSGIKTKVNILLYPGESLETISETRDWLETNKPYIFGVSVYPTIFYGFEFDNNDMWNLYKSQGATLAQTNGLGNCIKFLNLSTSVSYEDSLAISQELSREFMTDEQYYILKSFSYFSPKYTFDMYISDLEIDNQIY